MDKNIHWKIVRSTWNKLQKVHVDDYQMKMKNKYKNGYHFDKNMCYKNGEIISEEVQKKRYQIGKKANWRNPNSTDLKEIDDKKMIGNYINKYMNKQDNEDENNNQKNTPIKSYWGKNQELECLRYGKIYENQLTDTTRKLIVINTIKKIEENNKTICTIHNKINEADISEIENEALKINQSILKNVREKSPLIHNITNYVTVNDCANVVLACGASPIMADDQEEVAEITSICTGLNINIGTLNHLTIPSMFEAGKISNKLNHPILLDPVGAGASTYRTNTAKKLIEEIQFSVIRGNISEIKALAGNNSTTKFISGSLIIDSVIDD